MRVVHLSTVGGPLGGGAYRAPYRIHQGLLASGVQSSMLCLSRNISGGQISAVTDTWSGAAKRAVGPFFDRLQVGALGAAPAGMWTSGLAGMFDVSTHPLVRSADVLALYFVGAGFLSIGAISKLLKLGKPVVWRLSDMWAFTGGCHYADDCTKFTASCGACPQLNSTLNYDLSRLALLKKQRWDVSNLTVATPSRWLKGLAEQSAVLRSARIRVVPTGVDTALYRPIDKTQARSLLGLPLGRKLLLTGGLVGERKGGPFISELLQRLFNERDDVDVIALQHNVPTELPSARVHVLGRLNDELTLALAYAASDVFLAPFGQDNLPNTVLESLSCATPVVGFEIGGITDAVEHAVSGLLSAPGDAAAFDVNLKQLLDNPELTASLGANGRARIQHTFELKRQVATYQALYTELLSQIAR